MTITPYKDGEAQAVAGAPAEENAPFDSIPPELLQNIFYFLSEQDLKQANLVCKQWRLWATEVLKNTSPNFVEIHFHRLIKQSQLSEAFTFTDRYNYYTFFNEHQSHLLEKAIEACDYDTAENTALIQPSDTSPATTLMKHYETANEIERLLAFIPKLTWQQAAASECVDRLGANLVAAAQVANLLNDHQYRLSCIAEVASNKDRGEYNLDLALEIARSLSSRHDDVIFAVGKAHVKAGKYDEAKELIEKIEDKEFKDLLLLSLGKAYAKAEKYDEAKELAEQIENEEWKQELLGKIETKTTA